MPSLSEVPFDMEGVERYLPAGTSPVVVKAMKLFYLDIMRRTDDMVTVALLDPSDPEPFEEPTEGEIESYRLGVMVATSTIMELFEKRGMTNMPQFGQYLGELFKAAS